MNITDAFNRAAVVFDYTPEELRAAILSNDIPQQTINRIHAYMWAIIRTAEQTDSARQTYEAALAMLEKEDLTLEEEEVAARIVDDYEAAMNDD